MVTESIAILSITLCILVIFVRRERADYAASLVPVFIVPGVHLLAMPLVSRFSGLVYAGPYQMVLVLVDIAALAVSCLCIVLLSNKVKSKKNKKLYVTLFTGYNILLTCAYSMNLLHPVLASFMESK